jgi:hypothetical protein
MKTKKVTFEVCDAVYISVSCERNDWADIKCGGSPILGYDFYVSPDEDIKKIKKEIERLCRKHRRGFLGISDTVKKDFKVEHLWTVDKIEECIKKHGW